MDDGNSLYMTTRRVSAERIEGPMPGSGRRLSRLILFVAGAQLLGLVLIAAARPVPVPEAPSRPVTVGSLALPPPPRFTPIPDILPQEPATVTPAAIDLRPEQPLDPVTWAPTREEAERRPADHPQVPANVPVRVRVVTIQAAVTAYTAADHLYSNPEWCDGLVAWFPGGRKRKVSDHPYGIAADWSQFAPGTTFIRVPGYLEKTSPGFPGSFWAVDDGCGRSRSVRRDGGKPVLDLRFRTLHSAVHPRQGWGRRDLEVEVIFAAGTRIPSSLKRWVVKDEWRTYLDGVRIE